MSAAEAAAGSVAKHSTDVKPVVAASLTASPTTGLTAAPPAPEPPELLKLPTLPTPGLWEVDRLKTYLTEMNQSEGAAVRVSSGRWEELTLGVEDLCGRKIMTDVMVPWKKLEEKDIGSKEIDDLICKKLKAPTDEAQVIRKGLQEAAGLNVLIKETSMLVGSFHERWNETWHSWPRFQLPRSKLRLYRVWLGFLISWTDPKKNPNCSVTALDWLGTMRACLRGYVSRFDHFDGQQYEEDLRSLSLPTSKDQDRSRGYRYARDSLDGF